MHSRGADGASFAFAFALSCNLHRRRIRRVILIDAMYARGEEPVPLRLAKAMGQFSQWLAASSIEMETFASMEAYRQSKSTRLGQPEINILVQCDASGVGQDNANANDTEDANTNDTEDANDTEDVALAFARQCVAAGGQFFRLSNHGLREEDYVRNRRPWSIQCYRRDRSGTSAPAMDGGDAGRKHHRNHNLGTCRCRWFIACAEFSCV